ncbi:carbohydrate ABC transporter permease [Eisenbergiella sp.]|uniref:carbohydrate ABC transporter permease n=1 Tax=Eisenbergiella sp. TaxID=1924109 RepID=UPI00208A6831|nr:carbohydrate ABC transporter permease [Eisenbergiella sp.]BDF47823.1 ABC transporter permease [Lachnospiraceae bacterium]GKH43898.1 ABC transporter permease [Lachnospiraceae bacterium]
MKKKIKTIQTMDVICYIIVAVVIVITLYPVLHLMALSLSSSSAVSKNLVSIWPREFTLQAYRKILATGTLVKSFKNSLIYTALGTVINMLLTSTMAYALSKARLPLRSFFTKLVLLTMYFSGGIIPTFLLINSLGMYDSVWALVMPSAISTYNLIVLRSFYAAMPLELEEAAYLDGASDLGIFFRIVLPLSKAGLATISLFYLVGHWNSYYSAMIYLKTAEKYPLQLVLRSIVIEGQMANELAAAGQAAAAEAMTGQVSVNSIKYATLFISIVPMMIIYPFIQKYFVKGVMIGSLKG